MPKYEPHLNGCKLHDQASPLYSPRLQDAWRDVHNFDPPGLYEWCKNSDIVDQVIENVEITKFDVTEECCMALNRIELAIVLKEPIIDK